MGGLTRMPLCKPNTSTARSTALEGERREVERREGGRGGGRIKKCGENNRLASIIIYSLHLIL